MSSRYKNPTSDRESDDHAKKEVVMDEKFVRSIMETEGYTPIKNQSLAIGPIKDSDLIKSKFSCHWRLEEFNEVPFSDRHLITGFGPTNSPTGGTLSMILRALFFDKNTSIGSTIIISNLGAFNSRNISLSKIQKLTPRFIEFIRLLGYEGEIKTHDDRDALITSTFTSKVLKISDFTKNQEATAKLYQKLGIQGEDFGTYIDMNFTVADILFPAISNRKERILVFVGIEEYYFPKLAQEAIRRFNQMFKYMFTPTNTKVSAIFGHLIRGLNNYPKMSKSIPESSISLGESKGALAQKILKCSSQDEEIILQMIQLVSDWDSKKLSEAQEAFKKKGKEWQKIKEEYLEYFFKIKKHWEHTKPKKLTTFNLRKNLLNQDK
jgi:tryptophanyl-tRNA synthetase